MDTSEKYIYNITKKSPKTLQKFLIILGLASAAFFMVLGWILHLKFINNTTWIIAFLISLIPVTFEYLLNTTCTRYGKYLNVYSTGQMASISIIFGVLSIYIIDILIFKEKQTIEQTIGLILVAIGGILILWNKQFKKNKDI